MINVNDMSKEQLWKLREEIVLGSLFMGDFENSYDIDPKAVQDFFDAFVEDCILQMTEKGMSADDAWDAFVDSGDWDNAEKLYDYYLSVEYPFGDFEVEKIEEANKTKSQRHNDMMNKVFDNARKQNQILKDILKDNGISEEEIAELEKATGLHGSALHKKVYDLGLNGEFAKRLGLKESLNSEEGTWQVVQIDREDIAPYIQRFTENGLKTFTKDNWLYVTGDVDTIIDIAKRYWDFNDEAIYYNWLNPVPQKIKEVRKEKFNEDLAEDHLTLDGDTLDTIKDFINDAFEYMREDEVELSDEVILYATPTRDRENNQEVTFDVIENDVILDSVVGYPGNTEYCYETITSILREQTGLVKMSESKEKFNKKSFILDKSMLDKIKTFVKKELRKSDPMNMEDEDILRLSDEVLIYAETFKESDSNELDSTFEVDFTVFENDEIVDWVEGTIGKRADEKYCYETLVSILKNMIDLTNVTEDLDQSSNTAYSEILNADIKINPNRHPADEKMFSSTYFIGTYVDGSLAGSEYVFILADSEGHRFMNEYMGYPKDEYGYVDQPTDVITLNGQDNVYFMVEPEELFKEKVEESIVMNEGVGTPKLVSFLKEAYDDLTYQGEGTWYFDLGNNLYFVMAAAGDPSNYDKEDLEIFARSYDQLDEEELAEENPEYNLVVMGKIAVNNSDLQADYDYDWTMPYEEDGDVWDTEREFYKQENFEQVAKEILAEYNKMKDLRVSPDGVILAEGEALDSDGPFTVRVDDNDSFDITDVYTFKDAKDYFNEYKEQGFAKNLKLLDGDYNIVISYNNPNYDENKRMGDFKIYLTEEDGSKDYESFWGELLPDVIAKFNEWKESGDYTELILEDEDTGEVLLIYNSSKEDDAVSESIVMNENTGDPDFDTIEQALMGIKGTANVEFDYRPHDGVYKKPQDHFIVLVFEDDIALEDETTLNIFNDATAYFKNRKQWKLGVINKLKELGWKLEDPLEDNGSYLYLVMEKIKPEAKTECVSITKDNLTEKYWKYKLSRENANKLRTAIFEDNFDATKDALKDCWTEIHKLMPDTFEDFELEEKIADIDFIEETDEESEENLNYMLDDLYTFCDELDIWIPTLNESLSTTNEGYETLSGDKVEVYSDYETAKSRALMLGLKEAEYGDVYGSDLSYCAWNKSGDRDEAVEVLAYYKFENGKPVALTDEEKATVESVNELTFDDITGPIEKGRSDGVERAIAEFTSTYKSILEPEVFNQAITDMKKVNSYWDAKDIGSIYSNLNFYKFDNSGEVVGHGGVKDKYFTLGDRKYSTAQDRDADRIYFDIEAAKPYLDKIIHKVKNESLSLTESSLQKGEHKISDTEVLTWGWEKGYNGGIYYVEKIYLPSPNSDMWSTEFHRIYATEEAARRAFNRYKKQYSLTEDADGNLGVAYAIFATAMDEAKGVPSVAKQDIEQLFNNNGIRKSRFNYIMGHWDELVKKYEGEINENSTLTEKQFKGEIPEYIWGAVCSARPSDYAKVEKYLSIDENKNKTYPRFGREHSLIMGAARNNNWKMVKFLISKGLDVLPDEKEEFEYLKNNRVVPIELYEDEYLKYTKKESDPLDRDPLTWMSSDKRERVKQFNDRMAELCKEKGYIGEAEVKAELRKYIKNTDTDETLQSAYVYDFIDAMVDKNGTDIPGEDRDNLEDYYLNIVYSDPDFCANLENCKLDESWAYSPEEFGLTDEDIKALPIIYGYIAHSDMTDITHIVFSKDRKNLIGVEARFDELLDFAGDSEYESTTQNIINDFENKGVYIINSEGPFGGREINQYELDDGTLVWVLTDNNEGKDYKIEEVGYDSWRF